MVVVSLESGIKYLTGIHALNLPCSLETTGDWHQSALVWKDLSIRCKSESVFGDWGIEFEKSIPECDELFAAANHIRACLDLLESGDIIMVYGMCDDFICNDSYDRWIFEKVMLLRDCVRWLHIDNFMCREYKCKWLDFKDGVLDANSIWGE